MQLDNFKIAYIDDDSHDVDMLELALGRMNFSGDYRHFYACEEILALLNVADPKTYRFPNLIFIDLNLPGMSGLELLKELRSNKKTHKIPVIILTGSNRAADYIAAVESGCNGYVLKDKNLEEYREHVEHCVRSWALTDRKIAH